MKKYVLKVDKQCVYWLPCMAQDNLAILREGSVYMRYETQGKSMFYHVRSHITKPSFDPYSTGPVDYRNIKIKVRITGYRARDYYLSGYAEPFSPENAIEEISSDEFYYFAEGKFQNKKNPDSADKDLKKIIKNKQNVIKTPDELVIELTLIDYLPSGLALFCISIEEEASFYEKIKDILYYQVKLHFHQHHFHNKMEKTAKAIYISKKEKDINLKSDDNPGLLHYIEKFHEIITKEIDVLYQDYKIIDTLGEKKGKKISDKEASKKKLQFYDKCYDLVGLGVFVQSLLNCAQNKVCRLDNSDSILLEDKRTRFQNYASNIANARAGVEALRSKIKHHHDDENLKTSNRLGKRSLYLGWLSVFLGVLSIVLAVLSFEVVRTPVYNFFHADNQFENENTAGSSQNGHPPAVSVPDSTNKEKHVQVNSKEAKTPNNAKAENKSLPPKVNTDKGRRVQ